MANLGRNSSLLRPRFSRVSSRVRTAETLVSLPAIRSGQYRLLTDAARGLCRAVSGANASDGG